MAKPVVEAPSPSLPSQLGDVRYSGPATWLTGSDAPKSKDQFAVAGDAGKVPTNERMGNVLDRQ